jgi:hypothetical protein
MSYFTLCFLARKYLKAENIKAIDKERNALRRMMSVVKSAAGCLPGRKLKPGI